MIGFSRSVLSQVRKLLFSQASLRLRSMAAVRRAPSGAPVMLGYWSTNLRTAATYCLVASACQPH
ncbi:hypothetical protein FHG55_28115 [Pseudomonas jessenii]|uniref:Uncharacterized protein n=2 Tax=Pseudomonas TaxID=286 RepID=A0A5C4KQ09_PSEJE|nr:hypothetical protein E3Z29_14130 [Pseudomonas sp. S150]QBX41146.1 hypothetical protein E4T63_11250 [Pseudomonas fluorescens]TNB90630.1 hypothetical protein FHG55_28115 [Pseudomonas jessenii]